jgi:tetratricopeptide (TPR) repeat protein
MALLAKPGVVAFPLVLLLLAWWKTGKVTAADLRASAPFFACAAVIAVVTVLVHHGRGVQDVVIRTDGRASRLPGAGMAVCFYVQKLVAPVDLSFVYPRWTIDPSSPRAWMPLAGLVATFGVLLTGRNVWGRGPAVALACFVALLAPVLGFVDVYFMRFSFVADHWQYPACAAVIALAVAAVSTLLMRAGRSGSVAGIAVATFACMTLGALTWNHARLFGSPIELWRDTTEQNPTGWMPALNYGVELSAVPGRKPEAIAMYMRAVALAPDKREPYATLGESYELAGDIDTAIAWYRRAAEHEGAGRDPRISLAKLLTAKGQTEEAIRWYEQVLATTKDPGQVPSLLAPLYDHAGKPHRALELYRASVRRFPDEPAQHFMLAQALLARVRQAEADAEFEATRRLDAGDVPMISYGVQLLSASHAREAVPFFEEALRRRPNSPQAYNHLGQAMERLDRKTEAAAQYDAAIRLQPGFREAITSLQRLRGERIEAPSE